MRWWGPDALAVYRAHRGLPVGFLLLWNSVLFTVESLSWLYLLVISWFICFRRWCIDKLGVFHANQTSVSWSTPELRVRLVPLNSFRPSSKIFYWPFQGRTFIVDFFMFFSFLCLLWLCALLFICALWSPAGKGLTSWLSFVVSYFEFVTFPLVYRVRCGTWLYRFLIFTPLLIFTVLKDAIN